MTRKLLILCIPFLSCIYSCSKDEAVSYDDTPALSFESISPSIAREFEDSITIVIGYSDGDGDLGENDAGISNLFVIDTRIQITYPFRVQQLSPDGSSIPIKGKLKVVLRNTGITDGSTEQNVTYQVYMTDRAGHKSNTVTCSTITIKQ